MDRRGEEMRPQRRNDKGIGKSGKERSRKERKRTDTKKQGG